MWTLMVIWHSSIVLDWRPCYELGDEMEMRIECIE